MFTSVTFSNHKQAKYILLSSKFVIMVSCFLFLPVKKFSLEKHSHLLNIILKVVLQFENKFYYILIYVYGIVVLTILQGDV